MTRDDRVMTPTVAASGSGEAESTAIRVGVIGTGFGAAVHIPALQFLPETEVVAICSRRPERARAAAADHGIPSFVTDFREMVRDPQIDAVVVASPPHLHHVMSLAALEANKHVVCEKPMARNLAEARDMVKIAARMGVVAMVNHEFRFLPVRRRIKELIEAGFLGEPHAATIVVHRSSLNDPYGRPFGWLMEQEKAGGMLGATGSHYVDALRWWFGEVTSVAGAVSTLVKRRRVAGSSQMATVDADDNYAVMLRFANGAIGTIHVTATAAFEGDEDLFLSGSEGTLQVRDGFLWGAQRGDRELREVEVAEDLDDDLPPFEHFLTAPTVRLLQEWVRAIQTGKPASPSFADGVKVQELLDGVSRSSHQGRWIDTGGRRWGL